MTRKNGAIQMLLFVAGLLIDANAAGLREAMRNQHIPEFDSTDIFQKYGQGSLGIYKSPSELQELMNTILDEFPEAVRSVDVGQTYLNRTIQGYLVGLNFSNTNWQDQALSRPAILMNGAHHSRELTSISMNVYTILRLLFDYVQSDGQVTQLLLNSSIFFIPVVNVDGFEAIGNAYSSKKQFLLIRKNRHKYAAQSKCPFDSIGVDLNRNYPYMFGLDDMGSSGEEAVCADDYRGPYALSEPETQSIANFVTQWTNIKIVISMHSYGNLFVTPFNYDSVSANHLKSDFPTAQKFYDHLWLDGSVPKGNTKGNGATTVQYTANGEASDYFLGQKGVYGISPELGTSDSQSNTFFIQKFPDLLKVMQQNFNWLIYTVKQLYPSITFTFNKLLASGPKKILIFDIANQGLGSVTSNTIKMQLNMTLFKNVSVSVNGQDIKITCLNYHCHFELTSVPAETIVQMQVTMLIAQNATQLPSESVILEYWPNDQLDPIADSPKSTKLEVKLDIVDPSLIDNSDGNSGNSNSDQQPQKRSGGKKFLLFLIVVFSMVGLFVLGKILSAKLREYCRTRGASSIEDFENGADDHLFDRNDVEQQAQSSDEELAVEDQ